jgi:hypothetical protein
MTAHRMPQEVAEVRQETCYRCDRKCWTYRLRRVHYQDPAASCPFGHWGTWIDAPAKPAPTPQTRPPTRSRTLSLPGPGTVLEWIIHYILRLSPPHKCGCQSRKHAMNKAGWRALLDCSHRIWIYKFLAQEAARIGLAATMPTPCSLAAAALKTLLRPTK